MDLPTFLIEALKVNGSVLSAWAWPVAFIACAVIFKREVRALLHRIKSLKGGGLEAAFEEGLETLEDTPKDVAVARAGLPVPPPNELRDNDPPSVEQPIVDVAVGGADGGISANERDTSASGSTDEPKSMAGGALPRDFNEGYWETWWNNAHHDASTHADGPTGSVLRNWRRIEKAIKDLYASAAIDDGTTKKASWSSNPVSRMLRELVARKVIDPDLKFRIDELRTLRNIVVHGSEELSRDKAVRYEMEARYVVFALRQMMLVSSRPGGQQEPLF